MSMKTEPHMTVNATDPTASRAASGVKYSWKIHTLSAMLTIGLTMTSSGWDTLSGPHAQRGLMNHFRAQAGSGERVNRPVREHTDHAELGQGVSHRLDQRRD